MPSQRMKKEEATRIGDRLKKELGEQEFKQLFEETKKSLIQEAGPWPQPSWEDIVIVMDYQLSEKQRKEALAKARAFKVIEFEGTKIIVNHDGEHWKIYYCPVDFFEIDLPSFGRFLEVIEEQGEEVKAVIPNTGWVKTSIVLGTDFQGVKGFAVIARKTQKAISE